MYIKSKYNIYMYIILISHLMKLAQDINAVQLSLSETRLINSYNFHLLNLLITVITFQLSLSS